ncbi:Protein bud22 [Neolecta irregularis DAH-3]|uniref:Protein bud22 n=1 Tax=Neolecta irregularis (strain DAH-3) TaxID=1198029 RepID=A0A1U7LTC0_NEOID|nr:Protein bud22 [Neolecta irregularis DAH-3]|eukprot:OLL25833.1 Protein bud22 [Neolecta irregularis DAH-3]
MRIARKSTDNETLIRLAEELEAVKALDVVFLANFHLYRMLSRNPRIAETKFLPPVPENKYHDASKPVLNVVARLYNSRTIKDTSTGTTILMNRLLGDHLNPEKSSDRPTGKIFFKIEGEIDELEGASTPVSGNFEFSKFDSENDIESDSKGGDVSSEADRSAPPLKQKSSKTTIVPTSILKATTSHASTFLPTLSAGYVPGDNESDADAEYEAISGDKCERKNRRGQRARRQLWEKKYGKNANHVKIEAEKELLLQKRKDRFANQRVLKENSAAERPLHPSWEAKKKMREQLSSTAKFSGQKIKF